MAIIRCPECGEDRAERLKGDGALMVCSSCGNHFDYQDQEI